MIICFTGTGNSKRVALHLQEVLGDDIVRLPPGLMANPDKITLTVDDGRVIWVFPVYAWGLPYTVDKVMRQAHLKSNDRLVHHMVVTCGDDIGYTDREWRARIRERGDIDGLCFSVQMPNTYVSMKGFDVDKPEVVEAKLAAEPERSNMIAERILDYTDGDKTTDVTHGTFPWIKSHVLRPWFNKFKMSIKPFHAEDVCVGCGRCARNCPLNSITIHDGRPAWDGQCTMCLRCYHCCPLGAVQYGSATKGKGQYLCPGYKLNT